MLYALKETRVTDEEVDAARYGRRRLNSSVRVGERLTTAATN